MAFESLNKIAPALFSPEQDLIEVYNKKTGTVGVINPSYIKSSPSGSAGAIQFSDGSAFSSDSSNLFWDDTNKRLGVGTNAPVGILHLYKSAAPTRLAIDGDAGQNRLISYRTGALQRFGLYVNNTAESGSNAGSNFAIRAYNDAGTLLSTPLFINRATGNVGINTTAPTSALTLGGSITFSTYNNTIGSGTYPANAVYSAALIGVGAISDGGGVGIIFKDSGGSAYARFGFPGNLNNTIGQSTYGVVPDLGARLGVQGSGQTSATTSLLVENSVGSDSLKVTDDRVVEVPYRLHTPFIRNENANLVLYSGSFEIEIQSSNPTNSSGSLRTTGEITTTDNQTKSIINVNNLVPSTPAAFNTLNGFAFTSAITQTTGTIRGLFINPTLNASTDFRAIEATSGNVLIGNSASNTAKLSIKGSGSTSATTSLLVQNSIGTQYFKVQDDGVVLVASNTALRTGIASSTYYMDLGEVIVRNGNGTAGASMTIGKSSPAVASSILELSSTTKGFLPPRMTNSERGLITTPAIGLMVYCTDAVEGLYVYKSTGWTFVI